MTRATGPKPTLTTLTPTETLRWTRIGMLAALAMLLGYLETFVPIPIPGVKLGLANIAILIALAQGDVGGAFGIAMIKVLATGLLFGSPVTMAYSAAGTLLAFLLMAPISRIPGMHVVAVSVVGAVAHEIGQLVVAMLLLGTPLVWYSAPMLLVAGCATGALCGLVAASTVALLLRSVGETERSTLPNARDDRARMGPSVLSTGNALLDGRIALVGFVAYCVIALRADTAAVLAGCLAVALVGCVAGGVRPREAVRTLRPMTLIVVVTLVAQVASTQHGTVIATLGPAHLTREALDATLTLMARLLSITLASLAVMRLASLEGLVDAIAWLLRPLGRLGLRVEGFILALQSALRFLPVLAATMEDNAELLRAKLGTRELWTDVLPGLIARLYDECGGPGPGPADA